jgi:hypothetical protein
MAGRPTDDELREMLRTLPRLEPPSGFTRGVMARVRAEERRRRFRPWLLAAAAATLVASGLAIRSVGDGAPSEESVIAAAPAAAPAPADPDVQEFEELVREYRLLAEEIEAMRRLGGDSADGPMLRVGGNEDLDLFLDLESYLDRQARPPGASLVVPASTRPRR